MAKATKLPSGAWRCKAYYTDEYGTYTSKSFTEDTKKAAEYEAANFLMEMKHKKKPENKTVGELLDRYLENRSHILSPSTMVGYQKIRKNAFPKLMETRAGFVTKQMYQSAINEYAAERSPKTVFEAHRLVYRVFQENHIDIDDKGIILPRLTKPEISVPTTEEVKIILEAAKDKGIHLPIILAALMGLRKSEIFALTWDDIDIGKQTLRINKATVKNTNGVYVIKTTKTYTSTRTLIMPKQIIDALPDREEDLFEVSLDAFDSRYKRLLAKLGLRYNFHALRHYNASIMLQQGVPNKYAMERLGHATDNMLKKVYQHTFEKQHKAIDKEMQDFFEKSGI